MPSLNETMIAEQISRLLSHYWTASEDPALRRAQAGDWIEDLKGFPAALVAGSCALWRRSQTKRPLPADIIALCREAMPAIPRLPPSQEARRRLDEQSERRFAEAEEARQRWACEYGCKDFAEAMQIGLVKVAERRLEARR